MEKKYVSLLKKQIEKIDSDSFDLEAWKASTIALLARIYDEDDVKVKRIEKLQIDYSSWALRDAHSKYNPMESCKKQGREILQLTIDELNSFGIPGKNGEGSKSLLLETLESELKGVQFKEIEKLLNQSGGQKIDVQKLVKSWGATTNTQIVTQLVTRLLDNHFSG